jgi:hypothetical protein
MVRGGQGGTPLLSGRHYPGAFSGDPQAVFTDPMTPPAPGAGPEVRQQSDRLRRPASTCCPNGMVVWCGPGRKPCPEGGSDGRNYRRAAVCCWERSIEG